jgi:hypothetical protein
MENTHHINERKKYSKKKKRKNSLNSTFMLHQIRNTQKMCIFGRNIKKENNTNYAFCYVFLYATKINELKTSDA